jgi:hypothetical protein
MSTRQALARVVNDVIDAIDKEISGVQETERVSTEPSESPPWMKIVIAVV